MMKAILIVYISLLASVTTAYNQEGCPYCCTAKKVISPIVPKPTEGKVVSATCTTLDIKWTGHSDQTYTVTGNYLDPATQKRTETAPVSVGACSECTSSIPVLAGTSVSWSVQAAQVIENTTYYSYALRSKEEAVIPVCRVLEQVTTATTKQNLIPKQEDNKWIGKIYPNPVQSTLTVDLNSTSENVIPKQGTIRIFDLNGRTVMAKYSALGTAMQINVASLTGGTYIIRIEANRGKELYTAKFIKL